VLIVIPDRRGSRVRPRGALACLAVVLALTGCLGPRPVVTGVNKQPPASAGEPYRLQALIRNQGPGDGQIQVSVRFVDKRDGHTVLTNEQDVQLGKDEQQSVNFELNLPPGAPPPDQIDVQVDAQYPIE
jgi:hypothetical protein